MWVLSGVLFVGFGHETEGARNGDRLEPLPFSVPAT